MYKRQAPKNAFVEENMSKVMLTLIRERLKDNLHFKIIENPTGMNYQNLCNYNILGIHGEVKNPEAAADEFSRIHQIPIDYLVGGHAVSYTHILIGLERSYNQREL